MEGTVFLPLPEGLHSTEVCQQGTCLLIKVLSERVSAYCPRCTQGSDSVHSRYLSFDREVRQNGALCVKASIWRR